MAGRKVTDWFSRMSYAAQKKYLKEHPQSKYAKKARKRRPLSRR